MILIAGLGNPGSEYEKTRHNLGFMTVDTIASYYKIKILFNKKMCAYLGKGFISSEDVLLAKPSSFVNQSGIVIKSLIKYYNIDARSELIVICDDMDLPIGRIRIRERGGSGGHKGLDSIIKQLDSSDFIRIRLGIGKPPKKDVVEYVLSKFKKSETGLMQESISRACNAITTIINEGVTKAMSIYNRGGVR